MSLESDLQQFIGGGDVFQHWTRQLIYTEGIKHLADAAGAYWLIDAVASYQPEKVIRSNQRLRDFQLWRLEVVKDNQAFLTCCEDSGEKHKIIQAIEYTDFPLAEFEWYVCNGVMMLKNEY